MGTRVWISHRTMASFLIAMLTVFSFSTAAASLCHEAFLSEADRSYVFQSRIFSPILPTSTGEPKMWDRLLHYEEQITPSAPIQTKNVRQWRYQDDIGFLPSAQDARTFGQQNELRRGFRDGLLALHRELGNRLSEAEVESVIMNDWKWFQQALASNRVGYALIKPFSEAATRGARSPYLGFLRVYDGTDYSSFPQSPNTIRTRSSFLLPSERLLLEKQISTDLFSGYRRSGYQIYELGKYYLDPGLPPLELRKVRSQLLSWLERNYLSEGQQLSEKTVFVIDVGSPVHERAYRQLFGAEPVPHDRFQPRLPRPNAIMVVELKVLAEKLRKIIGAQPN